MAASIEQLAVLSVARGCGFAALGAVCTMAGLSFDPPLAMRVGGVIALMTTFILLLKAARAGAKPYRDTELWIMIDRDARPPAAIAQLVIGATRRGVLYRFAYYSAAISAGMLGLSLLMSAFRGV